jgi:hypothetical protein
MPPGDSSRYSSLLEELLELNVFLREKRNWASDALLFSKSEPEEN